MNEIPMFINSVNGIADSEPHNFIIKATPPIEIDSNKDYYLALDSISMSYSWYNVSLKYNNNILRYSHNSGKTMTTITLPAGNYSYDKMNLFIQRELKANGHTEDGITLSYIPSLFKVHLSLKSGFQLDTTMGDFGELIGFENKVYTSSTYSPNLPNITRGVNNIFIHTDIISGSVVSSRYTDILYSFSVNNLRISHPFRIEPSRLKFVKINNDKLENAHQYIRFYITDDLDRMLDLNDIPVSLVLIIKQFGW